MIAGKPQEAFDFYYTFAGRDKIKEDQSVKDINFQVQLGVLSRQQSTNKNSSLGAKVNVWLRSCQPSVWLFSFILSSGVRDMIIFLNILVNAAMQIADALASAIFYSYR
ncbi:hypothetical protein ACHWQZ_G019155 [Mnemiopsis leidyi]